MDVEAPADGSGQDPSDGHAAGHDLRRVLVVSCLYPPMEGVMTTRTVKFAKYLPEFGYRPVVLTSRTRQCPTDDAQHLIYRADDLLGPFKRGYRAVKLRRISVQDRPAVGPLAAQDPVANRVFSWLDTYLVPDPQIVWYPFAVRKGRDVLRSQPIELIYSTSAPETNHLVARRLKRQTGLPWVADFRDGWMFEPFKPMRLTSPMRRLIESRLERAVVRSADRIITVNDVIAEYFRRRYPAAAEKVSVISNGYDPEDFTGLARADAGSGRFRLVYTGALWESATGRSIRGLVEALRIMRRRHLPIMREIEVMLVGSVTSDEVEALERSGLRECFVLTGVVPYEEALRCQAAADVLLLVTAPTSRGESTTKLYEYLATGHPILALSGESTAGQLVRTLGAGVTVPPDDSAAILGALQILYERWKAGELHGAAPEAAAPFSRRELTRSLASAFDALV